MRMNRGRSRMREMGQPNISLTPLIDTALTLLVVFMVTASVAYRAVRVDLVRASSSDAAAQSSVDHKVVITVDAQGGVFFDGEHTDPEKAISSVELLAARHKNLVVCMHVDRAVSCGVALELFFAIRAIEGVGSVDFDVATT